MILEFDSAAGLQFKARIVSIEGAIGDAVKDKDKLTMQFYDLSVKGADVRLALFESLGGNNDSVAIHEILLLMVSGLRAVVGGKQLSRCQTPTMTSIY